MTRALTGDLLRAAEIQSVAPSYPVEEALVMAQRQIELLSATLAREEQPEASMTWQEIGMLKGLVKAAGVLHSMDIEVTIFPSELEEDLGKPVVQIDTMELTGPLRINLNDGPIWDANPEEDESPIVDRDHARRLAQGNNLTEWIGQ